MKVIKIVNFSKFTTLKSSMQSDIELLGASKKKVKT
jgi:hypothetical protein